LIAGMNDRAIYYRKMKKYPDEWGTAVNVQAMVYGNMGEILQQVLHLLEMQELERIYLMVSI
jgi:phosphoenolpyruvate synthase/pyruvate phosphate dikinase